MYEFSGGIRSKGTMMSQVHKSSRTVRRLFFQWTAGEMSQSLALDIAINAAGIVLRCRPHVESAELFFVSLEWLLRTLNVAIFFRAAQKR
jgi:hypothetical protein